MKLIFLLLAVIPYGDCDVDVLGYELGEIQRTFSILSKEISTSKSAGKNNLVIRRVYKRYKKESNIRKKMRRPHDISLHRFLSTMCQIEAVWSLAQEEWIPCLLSRSFALMKLSHLPSIKGIYNPILPPSNHTNKKIRQKNAKYLEYFLTDYKFNRWRIIVLDILYYTLQHTAITLNSLTKSLKQKFTQNTIRYNSLVPKYQSPPALYNICHGLLHVIPKYGQIFLRSSSSALTEAGTPRDVIPKLKKLSPQIHNTCNSLAAPNVPALPLFSVEIMSANPLNYSLLYSPSRITKIFLRGSAAVTLSFNSAPSSACPTAPSPPHFDTHYSLIKQALKLNSPFLVTYLYYSNEIFHLQSHILTEILPSSLPLSNNSTLESTKRLLSLFESINLSIFTIITVCGPQYSSDLIDYAINGNPFKFFKYVPTVNEFQTMKVHEHMKKISSSWEHFYESLQAQLKLLSRSIKCSSKTMRDQSVRKSVDVFDKLLASEFVFETLQEIELRKNIAANINSILNNAKHTEEEWNMELDKWHKSNSDFFHCWITVAKLAFNYSLILNKWVDLEKVYQFPLSVFSSDSKIFEQEDIVANEVPMPSPTTEAQVLQRVIGEAKQNSDNEITQEYRHGTAIRKRLTDYTPEDFSLRAAIVETTEERRTYDIQNSARPNQEQEPDENDNWFVKEREENPASIFASPRLEETEPFSPLLRGDPLFSPYYSPNVDSNIPTRKSEENLPSFKNVPVFEEQQLPPDTPTITLLPQTKTPFSFFTIEEYSMVQYNLIKSNTGNCNFKREMQFWLLVNHHPSDISSCFTFSNLESLPNETFTSAFSYPDAISLFVTADDPKEPHPFLGVYGWKSRKRGRDYQMDKIAPFIEYLALRKKYFNEIERNTYLYHHSVSSKSVLDVLNKNKTGSQSYSSYARIVQSTKGQLSVSSLLRSMLTSLQSVIATAS